MLAIINLRGVLFYSIWISFGVQIIRILGFPYGSAGKESTCNVRDLGLIPGLERIPGEDKRYSSILA